MEMMRNLARLSRISDAPDATTRLFLSPAHREAAAFVAHLMREAGLETPGGSGLDAFATVVGRRACGRPDAPLLLLGSHIDTVRNAGAYDGTLGVLAAIEAMRRIAAAGTALACDVEVLAFGDEEGVRWATTLGGSRAIAGTFDPTVLEARDADGVSIGEALAAWGLEGRGAVSLRRDRAVAFVELHIEQGPVLERAGAPLGVVTAVNGASRFAAGFTGQAGHAGTVPMGLRRDALAGAAAAVLAVRDVARTGGADLVATVGRLEVAPGSANTIPGEARFTIDVRAPQDAARHAAVAAIEARLHAIAAAEALGFDWRRTHAADALACDGAIMAGLARAIAAGGDTPVHLPSGAGHDAMAMAALCPVGMMFVRCRGGISHHPDEHVDPGDAERAVAALVRFLEGFRP